MDRRGKEDEDNVVEAEDDDIFLVTGKIRESGS